MNTVEEIRNSIIDKILTISNSSFLEALDNLIKSSGNYESSEVILLSPEQIKIIEISEDDINNGRIITHDSIIKRNTEWLNAI